MGAGFFGRRWWLEAGGSPELKVLSGAKVGLGSAFKCCCEGGGVYFVRGYEIEEHCGDK